MAPHRVPGPFLLETCVLLVELDLPDELLGLVEHPSDLDHIPESAVEDSVAAVGCEA